MRYLPSWIPGAGFKRTAREWRALISNTCDELFKRARQTKVRVLTPSLTIHSWSPGIGQTSVGRGCLVSDALEEHSMLPEAEELIKWSSFTLFAGLYHFEPF